MIYNDQKDYDWFHPWLSQYGRNKRRTVGNRQQRFLSSASAITPRPESAEKPPKGMHLHAFSRQACVSVLPTVWWQNSRAHLRPEVTCHVLFSRKQATSSNPLWLPEHDVVLA